MKASLIEGVDQQRDIDGYPFRTKHNKDGTEYAEVCIDGTWSVLWSNRPLSKGGKQAFLTRQRDLKKAVWKKVHGHEPQTCSRCGLIVEGVDPRIRKARACGLCRAA